MTLLAAVVSACTSCSPESHSRVSMHVDAGVWHVLLVVIFLIFDLYDPSLFLCWRGSGVGPSLVAGASACSACTPGTYSNLSGVCRAAQCVMDCVQ
jgi:hypothetical protein